MGGGAENLLAGKPALHGARSLPDSGAGSPARPGGTLINFTCSCPSASKGSF